MLHFNTGKSSAVEVDTAEEGNDALNIAKKDHETQALGHAKDEAGKQFRELKV
jgi:hypothetical protein